MLVVIASFTFYFEPYNASIQEHMKMNYFILIILYCLIEFSSSGTYPGSYPLWQENWTFGSLFLSVVIDCLNCQSSNHGWS